MAFSDELGGNSSERNNFALIPVLNILRFIIIAYFSLAILFGDFGLEFLIGWLDRVIWSKISLILFGTP